MSDLPPPMTPAECDLRGFEFMPLMGDRLFKSATWIAASSDAKIAMLKLWWHAYAHEAPAASLPDNDSLLADYAGYGVMVKAWLKVKEQAMRGFVMCSDDRLYHPIVAELALAGWKERLRNREKQRAWRERNATKDGDVTVTKTVSKPKPNAGQGQGEGQGLVTPPIGGGGDAAKRDKTPAERKKSELWAGMKTFLVDSGESKDLKSAGAVITATIKRFDEATALAGIEATLHARPAAAIAYLEGACQQASGQRQNKQESLEAGNLAAAQKFVESLNAGN